MFDANEIRYDLEKKLSSATAIESSYGQIMLDDELRQAVEKALRPILERRIEQAGKGGASHV